MDYAEDYAGTDIPRNEYTENLRLLLLLEEYWGLQKGSELTLHGFTLFLREKVMRQAQELRGYDEH